MAIGGTWLGLVPARLRRRERWFVALGFAALYAAYSTLIYNVVQNGDAAVYNEQIEAHVFAARVIHVGYMLFGSVFRAVLPFQTDRALNVMALTFGIGQAAALYATARRWGSRLAGVSSVLCLLCSADYVRSMVLSEVDVLSASLVMIAFACYVLRGPVVAGVAFGLAMLCTPVSASMLPLFLFTFAVDERGRGATLRRQFLRVLWFGLAGLTVYLPWLVWHWHEYFYGNRGLFTSPYAHFDAAEQIARGWGFFKDNAWALLPLYLVGLASALTDRKRWSLDQPALGIILSVVATAFLVDRAGDVPVHLASLPLLSLIVALFLDRLERASRLVWAIPCCAFVLMGVPAFLAARAEVDEDRQIRKTYVEMRNQSLPLSTMLVDPARGFSNRINFEHYAYGSSHTGLVLSLPEFRRKLGVLNSGPNEYAIYFVHRIPSDVARALQARYWASVRTVNGEPYQVLLPRSVAQ